MDTDNRRVEHLNIGFAGIRHGIQDVIPDAGLSPSVEAVVAGRVGAEAPRQIAPWCTGAQDPEYSIQYAPVVYARNAAEVGGKDGLNGASFAVCESIPHDPSLLFGA